MSSWNRGHLVGQKPPLKPREVWSIRTRLQVSGAERDLALFNLAIDSKLRGCDLVTVTVGDVALSGAVRDRAVIVQRKTGRPVQFEITEQTRAAVNAWIARRGLSERGYLFPSRIRAKPHMSTRQCGRIVDKWVSSIGLDPKRYGTHSMRRTKAAQIYEGRQHPRRATAAWHTKLESTVRFLGIEVDDALAISEQVEL
ncbi:Phage integrase family protein [Mesorhizobium prunaredense]|uniref:Phage integrase family protein n=1 Tax=Mesorhizobium prunaredense TaxID=1631249 RepID=A0A1R3UYN8_9HYPH|nr:tyrosine-type recombinase/integrase [Mesorhizobium prunaredense]SIT52753.1 Phage integrase family protein [Mesorhizobium prunaredense]